MRTADSNRAVMGSECNFKHLAGAVGKDAPRELDPQRRRFIPAKSADGPRGIFSGVVRSWCGGHRLRNRCQTNERTRWRAPHAGFGALATTRIDVAAAQIREETKGQVCDDFANEEVAYDSGDGG